MLKQTILVSLLALAPFATFAQDTPGSHFIENWDLDGNGAVSLDEITERRGDVFIMFDRDEDGLLSAQEYVLFDETRAADMRSNVDEHGKGAGGMQIGMSLEFNDTNADGVVSKDEFVSNSAAWLTRMDKDADGNVTPADFGQRNK